MARQLADQLGDHLPADARAPAVGVDGEVEDVQLGLVQLVDHEADDLLAVLGDHADAVALAQAAEEVFLGPGELEALLLGLQDLGHVAADHPADMDADLFLLVRPVLMTDSSPPPAQRPASSRGWAARVVSIRRGPVTLATGRGVPGGGDSGPGSCPERGGSYRPATRSLKVTSRWQ